MNEDSNLQRFGLGESVVAAMRLLAYFSGYKLDFADSADAEFRDDA